jgi:hypothetical protein
MDRLGIARCAAVNRGHASRPIAGAMLRHEKNNIPNWSRNAEKIFMRSGLGCAMDNSG